jgi:hypothetical protein
MEVAIADWFWKDWGIVHGSVLVGDGQAARSLPPFLSAFLQCSRSGGCGDGRVDPS